MTIFKDIDPSFRRLVSAKNGIAIKQGIEAISQYIQNILLTQQGEKLFDPLYGTRISDYTEDSVNNMGAIEIKDIIVTTLNNELQDIIIKAEDVIVVVNEKEEKYEITISYRQSEVSESQPISFDIKTTR